MNSTRSCSKGLLELPLSSQEMNETANISDVEHFRYLGISIGVLDIVLGTFGNLLTVFAVLKNKMLRQQPFNMFIVNLSVIDLLTSSLMMPFNVVGYALMRWPLGMELCILQAFFYFSCGYTSVICLLAITLNRLVGIIWPDSYRFMSTTILRILLVLSWLVAPAFLLPFLIASLSQYSRDPQTTYLITGWKKEQLLCTFVDIRGGWKVYMKVVRSLFQFIPIVIMVFSYTLMFLCLRKNHTKRKQNSQRCGYYDYKRKMDAWKAFNSRRDRDEKVNLDDDNEWLRLNLNKNNTRNQISLTRNKLATCSKIEYEVKNNKVSMQRIPFRQRSCSHQLRRDQEVHLMHISIIVCATITLLFLPSLVVNLIPGNQDFDSRIHMGVSNISWLNSCVNPLIYAFLHDSMRKEYKRVLARIYFYVRRNFCKQTRTT